MNGTHGTEEPFAVASHEKGVAIFRAAKGGLRWEFSPDGVRWGAASAEAGSRGPLQPICAAERFDGTQLLCADAEGRMVGVTLKDAQASPQGVAALDQRLSVQEPFRPEISAESWYEELPRAQQLVIVRDDAQAGYRAFFSARRKSGRQADRRGCIGSATSPDLRTWNTEPPIFAPNLFADLLSPHVVSEGGRHVLFYATQEQGDRLGLRFAIAPHLEGPYERIEPDLLACDARATVHTVPLGSKRLVFFGRAAPDRPGILAASRPGLLDFHADGRPFVRFYDALLELLGRALFQTEVSLNSGETLVRVLPRFGVNFRLTLKVRSHGAQAAGVLFRTTMTGHDNLTLWLDFASGAVLLRRGVNGRLLARSARTLHPGEEYRVCLWVEGAFADLYLDDEWLLTCATEGRKSGGFGLATLAGEARFEAVTAQTIAERETN